MENKMELCSNTENKYKLADSIIEQVSSNVFRHESYNHGSGEYVTTATVKVSDDEAKIISEFLKLLLGSEK
jgi:hypothetical protein